MEILLWLLLPVNDQVWSTFRHPSRQISRDNTFQRSH